MSEKFIYELGSSTDSIVEQIISIREYHAINRYAPDDRIPKKRLGKMHGKASLPGRESDSLKDTDSYTETSPYQSSIITKRSAEFFDRFYIHNHVKVKSCQAKFRTSISNRKFYTSNSLNIESSETFENEKAEIYELNTHQVISLKGIRVNHKV